MILNLHWSLGDHACYSGIFEAYYRRFGEHLGLLGEGKFSALWKTNPFVTTKPSGESYRLRVERIGDKTDWTMYRPQRIFEEMTGVLPSREEVQPKLYRDRKPVKGRVAVCDEAGWPNRRGYAYFNNLVNELNKDCETYLIRNIGIGPRQIGCAKHEIRLSLDETIDFLATTEVYIGYDSGLAHLAAGVGTPYVMFNSATPPVVVKHDKCILALEACDHCCSDCCNNHCLQNFPDHNSQIIEEIKKCMA